MDIVLRASVMFFALYLLVRVMGKRELAQMTPFELIVLVVLGDLIQQGVTHNDFSVTGAILAISTMGFWALALSWERAIPFSGWGRNLDAPSTLTVSNRDDGRDVTALINGTLATGDGLNISVNSPSLSVTTTISEVSKT